jgi:Rnl2 family RNA ligase
VITVKVIAHILIKNIEQKQKKMYRRPCNMRFTKYNSITNHYNTKELEHFIYNNPYYFSVPIQFEVTEKIHGANFSIIAGNEEVYLARRTGILEKDEKFYGYQDVFSETRYKDIIDEMLLLSETYGEMQLYGELFGKGIQKGVYYGDEKQFLWYALRIQGHVVNGAEADDILHRLATFKVPVIDKVLYSPNQSIQEFLEGIPSRFDSYLTPDWYTKPNICEGVVIKPYYTPSVIGGNYFAIKKKNKEYMDIAPKKVKVEKQYSEEVISLITHYVSYINDTRTQDLMSKMGDLVYSNDMSRYVKVYSKDVMDDFLKQHKEQYSALTKEEQKQVLKVGGAEVYRELKRYLCLG